MSGVDRPTAVQLIEQGHGLLSRGHLRELGLERRGVDAVFRAMPVVVFEGYSRPMISVEDYLAFVERCTYADDRVRP